MLLQKISSLLLAFLSLFSFFGKGGPADRYNLTFLIHTSVDKKPIIVYDDVRLM